MTEKRLHDILSAVRNVRVGVYGDFCLDAYWILDPAGSEESVETGVRAEAVRRHYYSPGGAANVVANMAALKPKSILAIGSIGGDIFGRELKRLLEELKVDTGYLVVQEEDFDTLAFCKHYMELHEQLREDFGTRNVRSAEVELKLLRGIETALERCDIVIFNQQVPGTLANDAFIDGSNRLFQENGLKTVLLDSRHYGGRFSSVGRKINEVEAALLCGVDAKPRDEIEKKRLAEYGRRLFRESNKPIFITRGSKGILSFDGAGATDLPGVQVEGAVDSVGAGDTSLSAIALCLGAGTRAAEAAEVANLAAAVTVQKLRRTGTASGSEIVEIYRDVRYIHLPELAENAENAAYLPGSSIEICAPPPAAPIRAAMFDHDGTVSTLRSGWEAIMIPVMVNAILGSGNHTDELAEKIQTDVRGYINRSTGIQTLVQMETLARMVRDRGIVPDEEILTAREYKKIYNDALLEVVENRMTEVQNGKKSSSDFIIPGVLDFIRKLRERDITVYLASGTDRNDVAREAEYLGYNGLFNGGIFGAVDNVKKYSKKKLLRELVEEHNVGSGELLVVGDGPVELQECRRQNGIAVGIASDEVHPGNLNTQKRTRLIRAGAHFVVPDLSQGDRILEYLDGADR